MYGHKNLFDFVTNCTAPSPETDQSGPLAAYYKLPLNRVLVVKNPISLSGSQGHVKQKTLSFIVTLGLCGVGT